MRARAVALGLVLAVVICAITPFNNAFRQGTPLGGGHFPLAPFFALFILTLLAAGAGKLFRGRSPLTGRELLIVWILMVLVSGIAYTGLVRTFFINLTAPYQFAAVGNHWEESLWPNLHQSWICHDREAISLLYDGLPGGRAMSWLEVARNIPWSAWLPPLATWSIFIFICYFSMVCMVNLFSRQWVQNERMNFPLLQVPLLMEEAMDQGGFLAFLKNPYLLCGLSVPFFLHLMNGLNFYFPSAPSLPTMFLAGPYFPKTGLFAAFSKLKIYIYPAFIGFAFLTSRQISFSFWVFFVLGGLFIGVLYMLGYNIPPSALGVTFGPSLYLPEETQMIGAYLVFFLFIFWLARRHVLAAAAEAVGAVKAEPASDTEWFSVRLSFWGFVLGTMALIWWMYYHGLSLVPAFLVVMSFLVVVLVASRVICQGGIAYFTLTAAPLDGVTALFGTGIFSQVGIAAAAMAQKALFVDLRESLAPSLFHAAKVSRNIRNKKLILSGMVAALVLGVAVSFLAMLALCYKYGIRELELEWAIQTTAAVHENVVQIIEKPLPTSSWVKIFTLTGAAVMLVLVICYHRFYWWPIHPIGYLTAYSSSMRILWFSFFLGWLVNSLCMRYGGVVLFKKLRFFFVGLIIGDFLMGGGWALVGLFSDISYQVLPD
ncbi:MAG: DUF6785 family protein [Pseudomonadota bacterium]